MGLSTGKNPTGKRKDLMIQLHTEILKKGNKKEFAIIPFDEYKKLMEYIEDLEDLAELRKLKKVSAKEKTIAIEIVKREMEI